MNCGCTYCKGAWATGVCARCRSAGYCSVACQERDWRDGHHRGKCTAVDTGHLAARDADGPTAVDTTRGPHALPRVPRIRAHGRGRPTTASERLATNVLEPRAVRNRARIHEFIGTFNALVDQTSAQPVAMRPHVAWDGARVKAAFALLVMTHSNVWTAMVGGDAAVIEQRLADLTDRQLDFYEAVSGKMAEGADDGRTATEDERERFTTWNVERFCRSQRAPPCRRACSCE